MFLEFFGLRKETSADRRALTRRIAWDFKREKLQMLSHGEIGDVYYAMTNARPCPTDSNIPYIFGDGDLFAWGYGGTAPATFAFNILYHFTNDEEFCRWWGHPFRNEIIAKLPQDVSGMIEAQKILDWISAHKDLPKPKYKNLWSQRVHPYPGFEGFPPVVGEYLNSIGGQDGRD